MKTKTVIYYFDDNKALNEAVKRVLNSNKDLQKDLTKFSYHCQCGDSIAVYLYEGIYHYAYIFILCEVCNKEYNGVRVKERLV